MALLIIGERVIEAIARREREEHRDLIWEAGYPFYDAELVGWTGELVISRKFLTWDACDAST